MSPPLKTRLRLLLFVASAAVTLAADTVKIRIVGTTVEGSPLSLEVRAGSDVLDAMALGGGMTMSSSSQITLARGEQRFFVDTIDYMRSPNAKFQLSAGDTIVIPEHTIGTGYWQTYNKLLFEYVVRRSHGLPMTESWHKKVAALYERAHPAPKK